MRHGSHGREREEKMFENKTEEQAKKEILTMVAEYCNTYHNKKSHMNRGIELHMLQEYMIRKRCATLWIRLWNFG